MPLLLCPNCQTGMQEVVRNGVLIDVCPQCRGVWLDRGELEKLLGAARELDREYEREYERFYKGHPPYPQKRKKWSDLFDIFD
ncbi:MAG: zf-TFIIB domain-containing protein [Bacteroidetes bacterium]|nr:zf-TFIIB domain-containing protein [Rhodothermia bacterium]MCS7155042.1 zf-TFIIB domain-containing protein [Bacteroidota bacterium]MCX7907326.1 zf-TFIIB domain-containing protein [Bacteroidota bacterium]MDW8137947.1 zf-TFIIB domain-containing protein [Bacteroidota bacterium]MDW8286201.1 zf-TFIIB domain-containing protein [Bacteroidota bacterium]